MEWYLYICKLCGFSFDGTPSQQPQDAFRVKMSPFLVSPKIAQSLIEPGISEGGIKELIR